MAVQVVQAMALMVSLPLGHTPPAQLVHKDKTNPETVVVVEQVVQVMALMVSLQLVHTHPAQLVHKDKTNPEMVVVVGQVVVGIHKAARADQHAVGTVADIQDRLVNH